MPTHLTFRRGADSFLVGDNIVPLCYLMESPNEVLVKGWRTLPIINYCGVDLDLLNLGKTGILVSKAEQLEDGLTITLSLKDIDEILETKLKIMGKKEMLEDYRRLRERPRTLDDFRNAIKMGIDLNLRNMFIDVYPIEPFGFERSEFVKYHEGDIKQYLEIASVYLGREASVEDLKRILLE